MSIDDRDGPTAPGPDSKVEEIRAGAIVLWTGPKEPPPVAGPAWPEDPGSHPLLTKADEERQARVEAMRRRKRKRPYDHIGEPEDYRDRMRIRLSRNERVRAIIKALQEKRIDAASLPSSIKKKIVIYFMEYQPEASTAAVAEIVGWKPTTVRETRRALLRDAAWEIDNLDVQTLAVDFSRKTEIIWHHALAKGDLTTALRAAESYIDKLQSLGFVYRAPASIDVRDTRSSMKEQLQNLMASTGTPTVDEFIAQMRAIRQGGNGKGNGHGELPAPIPVAAVYAAAAEGPGKGNGDGQGQASSEPQAGEPHECRGGGEDEDG